MTKRQTIEIKDKLVQLLADAEASAAKYEEELDAKHPGQYNGTDAKCFELGYLRQGVKFVIEDLEKLIG